MATPIEMPQPGVTVEECLLVNWRREKGERVSAGDLIAEIETDKANFDIEAPVDGLLLETFFEEGALVPVFTNICVIGEAGEDYETFRPRQPEAATQPTIEAKASSPAPPAPVAEPAPTSPAGLLSPRARRFAEEHNFFPQDVAGSGPGGRVLEADIRNLYERSPRVSPLAREMIKAGQRSRGEGSGVNRMVLARDLTAPPVRLPGIRRTIARRMRESLATKAQYTMHASADSTGLLALRQRIKAKSDGAPGASVSDLVMYCAVKTLLEIPELNAELIDGELCRHSRIHLGFACDTPKGLVVPVIKDGQSLPVEQLAERTRALSDQAVNGTLSPDDMTGGTFTVSNLGSLGIEAFTPIINPPQVAILGVNAIQLKPVRRNGEVEFIEHIGLSLTCDHQVIDGAPGARFLQKLKQNIEEVETICKLEA